MWRISKAEIAYSKYIFLIYLALTVGITFLERALDDGGRFYVGLIIFLIVQNWLSFKAKERRDVIIAKLPLSAISLGLVRLMMIFSSAFLVILVYKTMHFLLDIQGHANYPVTGWKLINYSSISLFGFSLYFIFSDFIAPRLRELPNYQLIKERAFQILLLLAVVLQILGIVAFMTKAPNFMTDIFDVLFFNNPFDKAANIQRFIVISLLTAAVSVFSFSKRKNYLG